MMTSWRTEFLINVSYDAENDCYRTAMARSANCQINGHLRALSLLFDSARFELEEYLEEEDIKEMCNKIFCNSDIDVRHNMISRLIQMAETAKEKKIKKMQEQAAYQKNNTRAYL